MSGGLLEKTIFMGQLDVVMAPNILKTTLGSCVGVVLIDAARGVFGLAHVVLPESGGDSTKEAGHFADTAIPNLLERMGVEPWSVSRVVAKLVGGADMLGMAEAAPKGAFAFQVGAKNVSAVRALLQKLGIKVVAEKVGGTTGMQVLIDAGAGKVLVSLIGQPKEEL